MTTTPETADALGRKSATTSPRFLSRLLRQPVAVVCLAYLAVVAVTAVIAPHLLPDVAGEHAGDLAAGGQGPSGEHPLGTDKLGRDVLERLLVGSRTTLTGVLEALLVALAIGVPFGLISGYVGGLLDRVVSWLADIAFSAPNIIVVLVVLAVFPQSMTAAMVTFGVLSSPAMIRVARSATLPVREELYVAAARVAGLTRPYIISRHIFPRVAAPVIVQASLIAAAALLVQSGLAFLHLIVVAPAPSWGGMIADGAEVIQTQPWLVWPPGVAVATSILAVGLLGDAVRDAATESWSSPAPPKRRRSDRTGKAESRTRVDALLSIRNLSVSLATPRSRVDVVDGVSFDVFPRETVGVVGESGCGKTITALSILGLLPSGGRIDSGQIAFRGENLASLTERALRRVRGRRIGLVSQEPMVSLDPVFRVGWQLAEAVRQHQGLSRRAARDHALELLASVRLPDPEGVARRYPHELSGGMAQRVAIARALSGNPDLLIADEPTTALDVTVQAEILDLLRDLQRERNMAILLVTHDWGVVADICDRALVLYAGQVVEEAAVETIFRQPLHPYTRALLASNPHNAPGTRLLPVIQGTVPSLGAWPSGCRFQPRCPHATSGCGIAPIALEQTSPGRQARCIHLDQFQELS